MKRDLGLIGGLGLGACLMYIFDPHMGRRRRALARDKMIRFAHKTGDAIDVTSRDFKNRAFGWIASARGTIWEEAEVSDEVLAERVRSRFGFLVSHPSSIEVRVENGKVTLTGPILASEVDRLLRRVSSIAGVKSVENRLEAHQSADGVPGLQGEPGQRAAGQVPDFMQTSWSPATRFVAGAAAGSLVFYGARHPNVVGAAVATLGASVLARALTNIEFKRLVGFGAGRRAIDVQKIVNVAAPVEEVFAFWTSYQNFPSFMSNVREVRQTGDNRSHWVVAGPAGAPIEWDAIITGSVPNELLTWETVPGSPIQHAGIVRFQPNPDGTTRLDIRMSYNPVAGGLGHAVASIFQADPKSQMDQDLLRMKTMIETKVPPHDAARKDHGETYTH